MTLYKATAAGNVPMTPEEEAAFEASRTPSLPAVKTALVGQIDRDVDVIYGAVLGNRAAEYTLAEQEAKSYASGGYAGNPPDTVKSWMDAKGWTAQHAADDILATSAGWRAAQSALRAKRLLRKEQVKAAADVAACNTVAATWAAELAGIKTQLGL